jgi:VIT1/CCC1 family predicted Fe2+/Mn2+ transporter
VGAALPLLIVLLAPPPQLMLYVALSALLFLAALGGLAAKAGGADLWKGAARVAFWGALAMLATALVGRLFGVAVG